MIAESWLDVFAPVAQINALARQSLAALRPIEIGRGKSLFAPGVACNGFVLVLEGRIRVSLTAENGRTLVLYRVTPGETCVQTTLCLMGGLDYSAEGYAETPLRLVIVPQSLFHLLLRESPGFAQFVFASFGARLSDMTRLIETVAFARVDARLAGALLARAAGRPALVATHQDLADEIGAAREVVSRQLALFQQAGLVKLARGRIALVDRAALADLRCVI